MQRLLVVVLLLVPGPLLGAVETGQAPYFNVLITPLIFHPDEKSGTYYNTSAIQVGSTLYLYAQGAQFLNIPPGMCPDHDQILVFSVPMSQIMSARATFRGRASADCNENYGVGNVFWSRSSYNIIADKSDAATFANLVWLHSPDPVSGWVEEPFMSTRLDIHILDMVLKPASDTSWWGFFRFGSGFPDKVGRVRVTFSGSQKRIYVLSGGAYREVIGGNLDFLPDAISQYTHVNDLFFNGLFHESWEYYYLPHNGCTPCPNGYGNQGNGFAGSSFQFRSASETSWGSPEQVYSYVRCLPSDYEVGRNFPTRIDYNGDRYLISSDNEVAICQDLFSPYQGMRTVVTRLE